MRCKEGCLCLLQVPPLADERAPARFKGAIYVTLRPAVRGWAERCDRAEGEGGKREGMEYLGAAGGKRGGIQVQGKHGIRDAETPQALSQSASAAALPAPHSQGGAAWSQTCPGVYSTKVTISADTQSSVPRAHTNVYRGASRYKIISKAERPRLHSTVLGSSPAALHRATPVTAPEAQLLCELEKAIADNWDYWNFISERESKWSHCKYDVELRPTDNCYAPKMSSALSYTSTGMDHHFT